MVPNTCASSAPVRDSGLPAVGKVPWGTHLCQFYRSREDLLETLVPFFKAGLENNEQCLWITSEPLMAAEARVALAAVVPDLDARLRIGQIELLDYTDWYLRTEGLTPGEMLQGWFQREAEAQRRGYAGLRATGNLSWLSAEAWTDFATYEAAFHQAFYSRRIIGLCSYELSKCGSEEIIDVLRNHGGALVRRHNGWEMIRSATVVLASVAEPRSDALLEQDTYETSANTSDEPEEGHVAPQRVREASEGRRIATPAGPCDGAEAVAEQLAQLQRLTEALCDVTTPEDIATTIATSLDATFGVDRAVLAVADEAETELRLVGIGGDGESRRGQGIGSAANVPMAEVFRTGQPLWRDSPADLLGDPLVASLFAGVRTVGYLPLTLAGRRLGVLGLGLRWTSEQLSAKQALLHDYGRQIAIAIDRARSYQAARAANLRLQLLSDLTDRIAEGRLDLRQVLKAIVREITRTGFAECCVINLRSEDGHTLPVSAVHHVDEAMGNIVAKTLADIPVQMGFGLVGSVAQTGQGALVTSVEEAISAAREEYREHLRTYPVGSLIVVALRTSGEIIGTLTVSRSPELTAFTSDDQQLLQDLAARAALSVENAMLYERAQQERERAEQERQRAELASRTKDEFLAMLGHELRNPLSPMLTAIQLMHLRAGDTAVKERTIIERQVNHMVRLVDDLLDVSRITRGKVDLKRRALEIADVVTDALEVVSPMLEAQAHHVVTRVPSGGLRVDADADRLAQVIVNLLTNAAKYTPRGGTVTIDAQPRERTIALTVRDSGVGMDADLLPRVFDLFTQGLQASDRRVGGLGLGLTIAKNLVVMHGGTLTAHSDGPGKGSSFTLELPRALEVNVPYPEPVRPKRLRTGHTKLRVLIVDDNKDGALLLGDAVELLGHDVRVAYDGPEALRVAETFRPELALLDIGLPVMDGHELAQRLRVLLDGNVRLIAITGYGQERDRERSAQAGFSAHLVKPIDVKKVEAAILHLMPDRYPQGAQP